MLKLLGLTLLLGAFATVLASASDLSPDFSKVKSMINGRDFMHPGGVNEMLEFSTNLSMKERDFLFSDNMKHGAFSWLDLVVPSLGNWIVGDTAGAVVNLIGSGAGYVVYIIGFTEMTAAVEQQNKYYGNDVNSYNNAVQAYGNGLGIADVGLIVVVAFDFVGVLMGYGYAGSYNTNLKEGLGIAYEAYEDYNYSPGAGMGEYKDPVRYFPYGYNVV